MTKHSRWLALLFASQGLVAQTPVVRVDSGVVPWTTLTELPRLTDTATSAGLRYPLLMRDANVEGRVAVDVVIDEHGLVDTTRMRVVNSTHSLFTQSVDQALRTWRFSSPTRDGQCVSVRVLIRVDFTLTDKLGVPLEEVARTSTDTAGLRITLGFRPLTATRDLKMAADDSIAAVIAISVALVGHPEPRTEKLPAICLGWDWKKVPDDAFKKLSVGLPWLRNWDACPPTYTTEIQQVDANGNPVRRPPGAIDPIEHMVGNVKPWTNNVVVATGTTSYGTSHTWFYCEAQRDQARVWRASCKATRRGFS